jgi:two-component system LytT family response regulator
MMRARIRAVIVDDEALARKRLGVLLSHEDDIEIVGEAGNGREAVRLITALGPDLVFLDVQMPGMDGFAVLRELRPPWPLIIFVTAHDDHAMKAFDVQAVDYVLKPVVEERFQNAVRRVTARLRTSSADALSRQMAELMRHLPAPPSQQMLADRIAIRSGERVVFVPVAGVDWADAHGDYVQLHVGKDLHLIRETLTDLEARLPSPRFLRIHRSILVQRDRIQSVQSLLKGDYVVTLRDGTRLTSGRTYRHVVQALIR